MTKSENYTGFLAAMEELEVRFFGFSREMQKKSGNKLRIDFSRKTPMPPRQFETAGAKAKDFTVTRNGTAYTVEVYDETTENGRFQIVVKNKGDPTDMDWMSLT